ncbi:signal peptide peptidase SppA [Dethiobacter alkaliphilus]|uniref:signal peptide peptidase SppA n=1 Tax=Dethiobacter alkaliphilus TaxID=427926 RepID=UPI00222789D3|nr:signal peptide peptidase SppA [Dethiobacter alkaliphilus]MCW3488897.1 signal peptide peptidase SppA [Dethiobacter alkaliphilus]
MEVKRLVGGIVLAVIGITVFFALAQIVRPPGAPQRGAGSAQAVAVIHLEGIIMDGQIQPLFGAPGGTRQIIGQLQDAAADRDVAAVVLRINSPGGTPAASQEVYNEVQRLKESGKPVVVSVGEMAASGGYWIASAADEIVANPASVTGSIGVIMETTNFVELYEMLGIESEVFKSGQYKDMGSAARPLSDDEREIIQSMVDDIFQQFVDVVASGRSLDREAVLEVADGRIFTGRQAKELGLVDRLGDLNTAIDAAGELAGIEGTPRIKEMRTRSPWGIFGGGVNMPLWQLFAPGEAEGSVLLPR